MSVLFDKGPPVLNCPRCGARCIYAKKGHEARFLNKATEKDKTKLCMNCAVTHFFKKTEPLCSIVEKMDIDEAFRMPHIQQQFIQVMLVGEVESDLYDELDWLEIIANWELPI